MRILHLSNLGPTRFSTGGILHVEQSVRIEVNSGHQAYWVSVRPQMEPFLKKSKYHLRLGDSPIFPKSIFPDHYLGLYLSNSERAVQFLAKQLSDLKPDIVVLEGPWLWPLLKRAKERIHFTFIEIYSCHNIESKILPRIHEGDETFLVQIATHFLKQLEEEIVANVHAVVTLSNEDFEEISRFSPRQVIQASNGARVIPPALLDSIRYRKILSPREKNYVFISSNWEPHVIGLRKLVLALSETASSKPMKITVVGSIFESFSQYGVNRVHEIAKNIKIEFLGRIKQSKLSVLQARTDCFILPVEYGGGRGIKTSEALMTGKNIIGTSAAFRGFDTQKLPKHAVIEDNYHDFAKKMCGLNQFQNPILPDSNNSIYSWDYALSPWNDFLERLQNRH
jgi:Glycosyl transferases group 1